MTLLHLLDARRGETDRELSRARISQTTVRKLCGRAQLSIEFLEALRDVLLSAGWCFFCASESHYAVVKVASVEGWARISSNRINNELQQIACGQYDFDQHEKLLLAERRIVADDDGKESQ